MQDAIIVGGSIAGLSAALYLGRLRRNVLVFDTGQPCNRFSHASHGFLTRDHVAPAELLQSAREQLPRYATIQSEMGKVIHIEPREQHFEVKTEDGAIARARKVLLATGLRDELPPIPGIDALWGKSVFHCAYCDGWEQHDQPVGVIADGERALHTASLLHNLTADLVICTNGPSTFGKDARARLQKDGIGLIETPITRLDAEGEQIRAIVFADGTQLSRQALFIQLKSEQHSPLAQELGCAANPNGIIKVDDWGRTNIPGIYAAGDMATPVRQILYAAKSGASAAIGINLDLIQEAA